MDNETNLGAGQPMIIAPAVPPSLPANRSISPGARAKMYDVGLKRRLEGQLYDLLGKIREYRQRDRLGWEDVVSRLKEVHKVDEGLTVDRVISFSRRHGGLDEGWAVPIGVGKGHKKTNKVDDKPEVIRVASPALDQVTSGTTPRPVLRVPKPTPVPVPTPIPAPTQAPVHEGPVEVATEPGAEPVLVQPVDVPVAPVGVPGVPPKPGEPGYLSPSERARLAREKQAREAAEKLEEDKKYKFIPEGGLGQGDIPDDLFYR